MSISVPLIKFGANNFLNNQNFSNPIKQNEVKDGRLTEFPNKYSVNAIVDAYKGLNGIQTAKTLNFGQSFYKAINSEEFKKQLYTCPDKNGKNGENAGYRIDVSKLMKKFSNDLVYNDDAIKTSINIKEDDKSLKEARVQLKRKNGEGILFDMGVRQDRDKGQPFNRQLPLDQSVYITQGENSKEAAYMLDTKGVIVPVVKDGNNVILTNLGKVSKNNSTNSSNLEIEVKKKDLSDNDIKFCPIDAEKIPAVPKINKEYKKPKGEGAEIVIGMQDGRFVPEIIKSIENFTKKLKSGEIVLKKFEGKNAKNKIQLAMLAGGYGSRAEYTNASSSKIFNGTEKGSQSTKGVFRTATGLTPMETTFVTLHNAGLLDCSKRFKIGKNVKLYLNKSTKNNGNGGFTMDLYNMMNAVKDKDGNILKDKNGNIKRTALAIFPNDSMSRMTTAIEQMYTKINDGTAAVAMIAKEISPNEAKGKFGIMKVSSDDNEILGFMEKPKDIPANYIQKNGKCLTNTFQFAVSKEAFEALSKIEPFLPSGGKNESRDWSKTYIPILMTLTQKSSEVDAYREIKSLFVTDKDIKIYELKLENAKNGNEKAEILGKLTQLKEAKKVLEQNQTEIEKAVIEAEKVLKNQKIYAIPTSEPWADCGNLNALYKTTMEIAKGEFKLEPFERQNVLNSVDLKSGLIAEDKEHKEEILKKYDIAGEVMAVRKAKYVNPSIVDKYIKKGKITINN
ncbi:hypothetical protein IJG72_06805 [bacterium]|nr:hypothetical protein [bacterium]